MTRVIMLSGPIGAGKTTIARELIGLWQGPLVYIEGDEFWRFIVRPGDGDRRQSFRVLMRAMTAATIPFARSDYDVLLDFSIPPAFLDTAQVILKELPLDFVLVRPSAALCAHRANTRPEGKIAAYDHGFYAMFEGHDHYAICDDDADAKTVAIQIREGLEQGRFRVG